MFKRGIQTIRSWVLHQRLSLLQADPGLVRVLSPHGNEAWGFGFIEPVSDTLQNEHWLLYKGLQDDFIVTEAPLVELVTSDLDGWRALVRLHTLGRSGYSYVKATSEVFRFGDRDWETSIPDLLPPPIDPLTGQHRTPDAVTNQTDSGGHQLRQERATPLGYMHTYDLVLGPLTTDDPAPPRRTAEYWLLTRDFQAAGALLGPDTRVEPAPELSPLHLNEYAEAMREHWQEGARFVITGCATYAGLPEDL
jgi:hypothetical protein